MFKKEDDYAKITLMEDHRGVVSNKTRRDSHEIKVQEVATLCKSYNEFNDIQQYFIEATRYENRKWFTLMSGCGAEHDHPRDERL